MLLLSDINIMSAKNEETEVHRRINAAVDGKNRKACSGCVNDEGWCHWEEVKDDLLSLAQELEEAGYPSKQIRYSLYRQYNNLTYGPGNERTPLPTCCEKGIKRQYSDEVFKGFQEKKISEH